MFSPAHRRTPSGAILAIAALAFAGCSRPTDVPPTHRDPAQLTVLANVAATTIATMVITVSAPDISPSLVFNMDITPGGVAQGAVQVPAGSNRKLEIDAYDANHIRTHHGEQVIALVKPGGGNDRITIVLLPVAGQQPVKVEFGVFVVTVNPATLNLLVGDAVGVSAVVKDDRGNVVSHADLTKVQWATTDPSVFSVSAAGLVTALRPGSGKVVATYEGYAGTAAVTIAAASP
jgi:hypothetical protein